MNSEFLGVKNNLNSQDGQRIKSGNSSEYHFDAAKNHLLTLVENPNDLKMTLSLKYKPVGISPVKIYPLIDFQFLSEANFATITVPALVDYDQKDPFALKQPVAQNFYYLNGVLQRNDDSGPEGIFVDYEEVKSVRLALKGLGFLTAEKLPKEIDLEKTIAEFFNQITDPQRLNSFRQEEALIRKST